MNNNVDQNRSLEENQDLLKKIEIDIQWMNDSIENERKYIEQLQKDQQFEKTAFSPKHTPEEIVEKIETARTNIDILERKLAAKKNETNTLINEMQENNSENEAEVDVSRETSTQDPDIIALNVRNAINLVAEKINQVIADNSGDHDSTQNKEDLNEKDLETGTENNQENNAENNQENNQGKKPEHKTEEKSESGPVSENQSERISAGNSKNDIQDIRREQNKMKARMADMLSDIYKKTELSLAFANSNKKGAVNQLKELKKTALQASLWVRNA